MYKLLHQKHFIAAFFHYIYSSSFIYGQMSHEVRREIFERGHAAVLLPFDPVRDEVVLIEQIWIAGYDTSELPATGDGCRNDPG